MKLSPSRRKIFFAGASIAICLSVGLGAGLPAIANASTTAVVASSAVSAVGWPWAYTAPLVGAAYNQRQIGVAPTAVPDSQTSGGTTGDLTSDLGAQPATGAPLIVESGTIQNQSPASGILPSDIANIADQSLAYSTTWSTSPDASRTYLVDLMKLPAAAAWGLTGDFFIPGANSTTGAIAWSTNSSEGTALVTSGHDGLVHFTDVATVPIAGTLSRGPWIMLWAMTTEGYAVQISLLTMFDSAQAPSVSAADHEVLVPFGKTVTVDSSAFQVGSVWSGGVISNLTPVVTSTLPSNITQSGNTLSATGVTAGAVQDVSYTLNYLQPQSGGTLISPAATVHFVTSAATVVPAPSVTSLDPNHGPTTGGNPVTIFGSNLDPTVCTVTFDGAPADVSGGSNTFLNVVAPAHAEGLVDVLVTCNGLTSAPIGYTYDAPVVIPVPVPAPPVVSDPTPAAVKPPVVTVPAPAPVTPPATAPKLPVVSG